MKDLVDRELIMAKLQSGCSRIRIQWMEMARAERKGSSASKSATMSFFAGWRIGNPPHLATEGSITIPNYNM